MQVWPASEKLTMAPFTNAMGEAERSASVAESVSGLLVVPVAGLLLRLRNVLCLPGVQFTVIALDRVRTPLISARAATSSAPVRIPV